MNQPESTQKDPNAMLKTGGGRDLMGPEIAEAMADVEAAFAAKLMSDLPCVNELARHVEQYRGKMLRPMLLLLSAQAISGKKELSEVHVNLACVIEMIHMATLVHDDILDEATMRRRGYTVNHLKGNETAVMLGDYIFSHAYNLCSQQGSLHAARYLSNVTSVVCEGEILQLTNRNNWSLDEQTYFAIIERKTAALTGAAAYLGAHTSEVDQELCLAMERYGVKLGCAFQIVDDLLDLTGDEETVGKTVGRDLDKGKLTLPLIRRMETAPAAERHQIVEELRQPGPQQAGNVRAFLEGSDALSYTRAKSHELVDEAKAALGDFADTEPGLMLQAIADAVVSREY